MKMSSLMKPKYPALDQCSRKAREIVRKDFFSASFKPKPERFNWIDNLEVISLSKSTHKK